MIATHFRSFLGVPLAKPRVALSAPSPRSFLAVGFPLQSLTRNVLIPIVAFFLSSSAIAQDTLRFNYRDAKNVLAHLSIDSRTDSVYSPIRGQDLRMFRNDSTVVEIYRDPGYAHLVTRMITKSDSAHSWNYYQNGQLRLHVIEAGENFTDLVYHKGYYENGQLQSELDYHPRGLELSVSYWPNGAKQSEYLWYRGTIVGEYTVWHDNGQINIKGHFFEFSLEEMERRFCPSKEEGTWTYWSPDGRVEKVINYKDGVEIK